MTPTMVTCEKCKKAPPGNGKRHSCHKCGKRICSKCRLTEGWQQHGKHSCKPDCDEDPALLQPTA